MDTPQLSDLKATLPNFPDEILEDWLLPYAISEGWPPFGEDGAPRGSRWPYLLEKKPQDYWTSTNWSLHHGHIALDELDPRTQESIAQMILAAAKGEENLYSASIPDLKERFDRILSHLTSKGTLPGAPTLLKHDDGYRVVDGNHRIAAYSFYWHLAKARGLVVQPQRFWVGAT
ncbi:conserved hypothetical protein [Luteimonas sp. 9C]|uniref:hypothetical protein n=1 Tax=Luteimonas sp. 9C TaxID=2653148 RepID=UPI0012F2E7B9|nr:hypothetical protein [Luteimonas sp. 9C]VXB07034.1 conserved hypothetical protein [Luteimonas sp. 9C]